MYSWTRRPCPSGCCLVYEHTVCRCVGLGDSVPGMLESRKPLPSSALAYVLGCWAS